MLKTNTTYKVAASSLGIMIWSVVAAYGGLDGWWLRPVAAPGDHISFHRWAAREIESRNSGTAALVLIEKGGVVEQSFNGDVDADTLFPTASFSKWITALTVMSLAERQLLDLDTPVSEYLSRWQLPDSEFDHDGVTVRRLLSHTAGLTDGLGFGDYRGDETLPSIEAALRNPRASREAEVVIAVGREPGSEFLYSGGGYLMLQLLVEEISGEPFSETVSRAILEPLNMSRSTHAFLGTLPNVSPSYNPDGSTAPTYQYASAAATGFASTAADLSKLALALLRSDSGLLKPATVAAMREPHGFVLDSGIWGLGTMLYVPTSQGDFVFGHDGANDPAINTAVRINPETGAAFILLVSGHPSLASNIGAEWVLWQTGRPDFLSTQRALKSAALPGLLGAIVVVALSFLWQRIRRPSS